MKDIIAALEAKRAKLAEDARQYLSQKGLLWTATLAVVALLPLSVSASGTLWSSPKGDFVLTLPEGWEHTASPASLPNAMITISARPAEPFRACAVTGEWRPVPPAASQAQGNAAIAGADDEEMMDGFPTLARRVVSYSNELQAGIQVSSIVFEYQQPPGNEPMRSYGRNFIVIQDSEFRFYTVSCGVRLPATDAELAMVESFMNSLTFNLGQSQ